MIGEYIKLQWDVKKEQGISINGFEYTKKVSILPYKATMVARNYEVCQIDGRQSNDTFDLSVAFGNNESYLIKFWEQSSNIGTLKSVATMVGTMIKEKSTDAMYETMLPKIFDANGNQVGELQYIPVKQQGLQSYNYNKLVLNGVELSYYTVGIKRQIYYCMYNSNNQMVATVCKRMKVVNGQSRYTMYVVSDEWFKYVALATSIIAQMEDTEGMGTAHDNLNTFQKELLARYNPNFIPQVVAQAGPMNLPENMPLVTQQVKASQNNPYIMIKKIGFIIGMVLIAIVFIWAFFFTKK